MKFAIKPRTNGQLYVHFTDHEGKFQRKSADTKDMKVARARAPEIVSGQWSAPSPTDKLVKAREVTPDSVTMAQLFDVCMGSIWSPAKVRSQATVRSNVRTLNKMIGSERVKDMTFHRLERLVTELRGQGYKDGTVDRKLSCVSAALTKATEMEDADGRPWLIARPRMPVISVDNFLDRTMSAAEEKLVFEIIAARAAREPMRDWIRFGHLIRFLLDTACRKGEAILLRDDPRHISTRVVNGVEYTTATFWHTKNGKPRTIPLTPAVVASLPFLRASAVNGYLFPYKHPATTYYWENVRQDALTLGHDLSTLKLHSLRHTCITRMATQKGTRGNIHKISKFAGHSSVLITDKRYSHLIVDDLVELI